MPAEVEPLRLPLPHTRDQMVDVEVRFNAPRMVAKLPDFRFHDLLYTAASSMADS